MSARMARWTIATLAACLLSACTGAGDSDSAPSADTAAPHPPLRGTTWGVTTLIENRAGVDQQTAVNPAVAADLMIAEDGAVTGSGGCNRLIGTATVRDESPDTATISFQVGSTLMMCEPEAMAVENAVLAVLTEDTDAVIAGDTLTLRAEDGRGLILVAAQTP